ncbi:MAG: hypothetical protein JW737_03280, partial [Acidobacteria bacterium]|nr:hypothetical protein [Acidobacteriota bacterium]
MIALKRKILSALIFIIAVSSLNAQMIPELTFRNQQLNVILLTLAEQAGVQIITDSTVSGNASFYFAPMKLETALTLLLDTYGYYFWEKNGVYYVSKIRVLYNENTGLCSVDSEDVDIIQVLNKISSETKITILKD